MPPPSYCSKISTRSTGDHEPDIEEFNHSKTETTNSRDSSSEDDSKVKYKYDGVGIVKSLLGPSFEDAVLRTLEFGKSLIQKGEENEPEIKEIKNKKISGDHKKEIKERFQTPPALELMEGKGDKEPDLKMDCKNFLEGRSTRKRIVFTAKLDKDIPLFNKVNPTGKKLSSVSKIRSLDSDLKRVTPSPEKIKKQLEALIQINKDEPPEHAGNWSFLSKTPKLPVEVIVMPSVCMYRNQTDLNYSSSCDVPALGKNLNGNDTDQCSTSRLRTSSTNERTAKKRLGAPSSICQAPEFISNALGPTLDVSIIDNIKMMRDLFKCESGKGEGIPKLCSANSSVKSLRQEKSVKLEGQIDVKEDECDVSKEGSEKVECKIEMLQKRVDELEEKEQCLVQLIEEEERERECRRRAFEEEERKLCNMKACLESLMEEERRKECCKQKSLVDCKDFDAKYENIKQRIACEEEKLSRLKDQYECYRREIIEAKQRKEILKRNKSLLDAWDVIASRVCHTRLPSFSRAYDLERKQLKPSDNIGNVHCCFLPQVSENPESSKSTGRRSRSRSRCSSRCGSRCNTRSNLDVCITHNKESEASVKCCKVKHEDIPFPIQRDIICGMHQSLKTCSCSTSSKNEGLTCSSDDELLKKFGAVNRESKNEETWYSMGLETPPEKILGKPPSGKHVCRSRSETAMKRERCPKIVKVMWAVTRINIFQDNCRTYEVMDATSTPPSCVPAKTEGIFVVKNPQKKICPQSMSKKRCSSSNASGI